MKPRHFSMLREFHLADWFTLGNAFCGTGAIFAAMRYLQDGVVRDLLLGMALIVPVVVYQARRINLLEMGDDAASQLGVTVERTRLLTMLAAVALPSLPPLTSR